MDDGRRLATLAALVYPSLARVAWGVGRRGRRGRPQATVPAATGPARLQPIARAAVLATFVALLVHTMAYAGFFEDPITWVLLAVGASLAAAAPT